MVLDDVQREIVTSSSKNIIVSAGAGSGKTRVLVERIKYLLESGIRPDNIVAITFTNRAADEMKSRLMDVSGIGDAFIGTIHSFANRIFHNSGTSYEILTQEKEIEIMKSLIDKFGKYLTYEEYLQYLDIKRDISLGIKDQEDLSEALKTSSIHELAILYGKIEDEEYPLNLRKICSQRNILTFDRLLEEATKYFQSINGSLEYLLVDELQDIGYLEYQFLSSLNASNHFYVGDDWQSIYAFKGGDVRIFLRLMEDPNWSTYYLNKNYRNSTNILDLAGTVIRQADRIIQKEIIPVREDTGTVQIDSKYNLKKYLNKIRVSEEYRDWFILVRNNRDILKLAAELELESIPYITFKQGANTTESLSIKVALNAVKLITVHTAKGLESKNVLLYGNFPVYQKSYMKDSDERKVMYVGITRAQDNLIILN